MTILEIMIVLAIIGLMMLIGLPAVRSLLKTDLRKHASGVAATLRAGYELATLSGIHHRVVFDLDAQTYELQACPEKIELRRDASGITDPEALEAAKQRAATAAPAAGGAGLAGALGGLAAPPIGAGALPDGAVDDPEAAVKISATLAGDDLGGATCTVPTTPNGDADGRGNQRQLDVDRGIRFGEVHVQHLDDAPRGGKVAINFFPLGWAEKAVVEVATEDGDRFSVVLHGMTGKVEVREGAVDADRILRRNAAGDQAEAR
jgi:type II secretory pathway pseudopilin PulG